MQNTVELSFSGHQQLIGQKNHPEDGSSNLRKYSVDAQPAFKNYGMSYSFSGFIDDQFLQPHSFCSFDELSQILPSIVSSPDSYSPSTPGSFGFRKSASRQATVRILHMGQSMLFQSVRIFLVADVQDSSKAGLLFKNQQKDIDLKIEKSDGQVLDKNGFLDNIQCQLWVDDYGSWFDARTTIRLQD